MLPPEIMAGVKAQKCIEQNPSGCTVLMVDNATGIDDAVIYLYGGRIGQATGGQSTPFYIPNSRLHQAGLCAVISVRLQLKGSVWQSREECLRPGGFFHLMISAPFSTTSLVPW
jgi:hypothetical protein